MTEEAGSGEFVQALVVERIELRGGEQYDGTKYPKNGMYLVHYTDNPDMANEMVSVFDHAVVFIAYMEACMEPVVRWKEYREKLVDLEHRHGLAMDEAVDRTKRAVEWQIRDERAKQSPGGISEATHVRVMELMVEQVRTMVKGGK